MFTVSREFKFCYAHRLQQHAGKCAHLHGHNGTINIELRKDELNPQGMVLDFVEIKNTFGKWIDETLDHRTILHESDPLVSILISLNEPVLALSVDPTAENLAKIIYDEAENLGLPVDAVAVGETEKCTAMYRKRDMS